MASAVSDCKNQCIHYWVCKNQIQPRFGNGYPKYINIKDCEVEK